jgi:hypothetical protein
MVHALPDPARQTLDEFFKQTCILEPDQLANVALAASLVVVIG